MKAKVWYLILACPPLRCTAIDIEKKWYSTKENKGTKEYKKRWGDILTLLRRLYALGALLTFSGTSTTRTLVTGELATDPHGSLTTIAFKVLGCSGWRRSQRGFMQRSLICECSQVGWACKVTDTGRGGNTVRFALMNYMHDVNRSIHQPCMADTFLWWSLRRFPLYCGFSF